MTSSTLEGKWTHNFRKTHAATTSKPFLSPSWKDWMTPIWPPQQSSGYTIIFAPQSSSWFLLINDLTLTFVQELKAIALKFLKSWAGLPRCANSAVLFVGERNRFGLCIRNLETLWKQQQHIRLSLLHSSTDHRCKAVLEIICKRQGSWTKKFAPAVLFQCVQTVVESNTNPPSPIQHTTAEREQQTKQQQPH